MRGVFILSRTGLPLKALAVSQQWPMTMCALSLKDVYCQCNWVSVLDVNFVITVKDW